MIYPDLAAFHERPAPFSRYTVNTLWTDPHIGRQMLAAHLNPDHDAASRRPATIDATIAWIDARLGLADKRVVDLGCGPGLYARRMALRGASVTGLDFSPVSIGHAMSDIPAGVHLTYELADYLTDPLPGPADIVTLIYGDYCALSPTRRAALLSRIRAILAPGGRLVFDVYSTGQLAGFTEGFEGGPRYMNGFWAEGDYFAFKRTLVYPAGSITLERYLVATPDRQFEIFNWMQYFTPATITAELAAAGFTVDFTCDLTGHPWPTTPTPFFIAASAA